jgi:hypothetical protein
MIRSKSAFQTTNAKGVFRSRVVGALAVSFALVVGSSALVACSKDKAKDSGAVTDSAATPGDGGSGAPASDAGGAGADTAPAESVAVPAS